MKKYIFLFVSIILLSCTERTYPIESRAHQQLRYSLPMELTRFCEAPHSETIENEKLVYVNDSICILQFTCRFMDVDQNKYVKDLRYIYLLDMLSSRESGKAVYKEEFLNVLCLPDEMIEELCLQVEISGENVYSSAYGSVLPIHNPFDSND